MKILHTSDWHLGKKLEGYSRLEEQESFINELVDIANENTVDLILVAGDIYDTANPQAEAERLYYNGIKRLSDEGKRPVVVIAGNHDNPTRITASEPLALENGILAFGNPMEVKNTGTYGQFEVKESCPGGVLLELSGREIFINAMPYPSEKSLSTEVSSMESDSEREMSYSEKVGKLLQKTHSYKKEGVKSIIVSHLNLLGESGISSGEGIYEKDGERDLSSTQIFNLRNAPEADYIALGHIHKPMVYEKYNAAYSGSNLEYRVSEARHDKKVLIKDLESGALEKISLNNRKPIKEYVADSIERAIEISEKLSKTDEWIYLSVESDRPLTKSELKEIKKNKNIIFITPMINWGEEKEVELESYSEENIIDAFKVYYKNKQNTDIDQESLDMFIDLLGEDA